MEVELKAGVAIKEERKAEQFIGDQDKVDIGKVPCVIPSEKLLVDSSGKPSSSSPKKSLSQEEKLESTKVEMGEVREENERLKTLLTHIVEDYRSLQMHYFDIVHQENTKKPNENKNNPTPSKDVQEDHEFVSLSLGSTISPTGHNNRKEEKSIERKRNANDNKNGEECLKLGLEYNFEGPNCKNEVNVLSLSPENSLEETKEEKPGELWPPSKIIKSLRSGDDELSQQTQVKKARVSVRARCDAPTMNDGCQWRKYGQKISKGNPCPRAYYRCTVAPGCPVRKQVQRCADDMSILITTYEGTHNHPLPISATAMASTTSAAVSMLMSDSSTSSSAINAAATTTTAVGLHGLSFGLVDNSRPHPYFLPSTTISSTPSYPTITLDLTAPPSSTNQPFSFNRFTSNPRYPSTNFNFSSSESTGLATSWPNGYLGYGNPLYNKSSLGSTSNFGRQAQDSFLQSYMQKVGSPSLPTPSKSSNPSLLTDSIAKALTSDPSFQSALAAAITSYVGGDGSSQAKADNPMSQVNGLKWGEQLGSSSTYSATPCASSYLNTKSSAPSPNTQNGTSLLFSLGYPSSKSASASPVENRDKH